jgi:hypothetical protein
MTMSAPAISSPALLRATALGTVFQVAMVLTGHSVPAVAHLFALLGLSLSLLAGIAYAIWAAAAPEPRSRWWTAAGGAVAGGLCALIGIAVSVALGDVPAAILGFGTAGSAVTGALGGLLGAALGRRRTPVGA